MTAETFVRNALVEDRSSVWRLKSHEHFGYTDGVQSEQYLDHVFRTARDLKSGSDDLVSFIKDWPSAYHLSPKRAQLLSGFSFERTAHVLEVGCGCGAITRHLGETFNSVVSIEGSLERARLARARTRDLDTVSIICAPFQDIRFKQKFDLIFVVGVYEYSGLFVGGDDPYQAVLAHFSDLLTDDGAIVVAIENQFGLKYFNGCREDHIGKTYQGLEGYHRGQHGVRTFGRGELKANLHRYFSDVQFYYPFPDYKMPDCVLSEEALRSPRSGELVAQLSARKNEGPDGAVWDEPATVLELARNGLLPELANSFLVVAGKQKLEASVFDQLGVLYAPGRKAEWRAQTHIVRDDTDAWMAQKTRAMAQPDNTQGPVRWVASKSAWQDGLSLQTELALRAMNTEATLADIVAPCHAWVAHVKSDARLADHRWVVSGGHFDRIWQNFYVDAASGDGTFIDQEWVWHKDIPVNVLAIRAIYQFLAKTASKPGCAPVLQARSGQRLIAQIGAELGLVLTQQDFADFVALETQIAAVVFGRDDEKLKRQLQWYLWDRTTQQLYQRVRPKVVARWGRLTARISQVVQKLRVPALRSELQAN